MAWSDMTTNDAIDTMDKLEATIDDINQKGLKTVGLMVSHVLFLGLLEASKIVQNSIPINIPEGNLALLQMMDEIFGDAEVKCPVVKIDKKEFPIIVSQTLDDNGVGAFKITSM